MTYEEFARRRDAFLALGSKLKKFEEDFGTDSWVYKNFLESDEFKKTSDEFYSINADEVEQPQ